MHFIIPFGRYTFRLITAVILTTLYAGLAFGADARALLKESENRHRTKTQNTPES